MKSLALCKLNSCSGKQFYSTQDAALSMAKHRSKVSGVPLYVYACRTCRGYHLTKHETPIAARRRELTAEQTQANNIESSMQAGNVVRFLLCAALRRMEM